MLTHWMKNRTGTTGKFTTCSISGSIASRIILSVLCGGVLAACGGGYSDSEVISAASDSSPALLTGTVVSSTTSSTTPANGTWIPAVTDTWQWQLSGKINTSYPVTVYDIDLFDTPQATIDTLKSQGKRVVCYFSAGSSENWRPDFKRFLKRDMGKSLSGWAGERWLDTRSANVRRVMQKRLDLAKSKGCDGVEPDNVDAYTNKPGFPLNASTQLNYNRFLAKEARARGLAIGLKNDVEQVEELAAYFDFAVNEQCFQYNECAAYAAFTSQGKPVFNAEYARKYRDNINGARDKLCQAARQANIRTLVLPLNLDDSFRYTCD